MTGKLAGPLLTGTSAGPLSTVLSCGTELPMVAVLDRVSTLAKGVMSLTTSAKQPLGQDGC